MEYVNLEEPARPYNIRHRSFYFAKEVILFVKECKYEKVSQSLYSPLIRCASSIGANLVEGKAGSTKKDWKNFYHIALKSANETKYWLCLIKETQEVDLVKVNQLIKEADELSKIIASIIVGPK